MTTFEVDASQLARLEADLGRIPPRVNPEIRRVVVKGSLNIKTEAQKAISGLDHAPHYPAAITYDTTVKRGVIEGEIGPDKARRQGSLGNILEYGTSKNAPFAHLGPALDREGPRFEAAAADAAGKLLGL